MNPALWISKTGLDAQQTRLSVISNNLANVNTTGFKRDQAIFQDLIYQNKRQAGGNTTEDTRAPSGLSIGTGVRVVGTEKLHTQGNITQTGKPLDMAVQGRGFFQIQQQDGSLSYTRDGTFQIDADGQVVTSQGLLLQPALTIPADTQSITIGADGTVTVLTGSNTTPTQIGSVQLADFVNPAGLQPEGDNLFTETAASGSPTNGTPGLTGLGTLLSGSVETSNVNVVEELVNMIETQRAYEMNSKVISTTDQMLQYVNNNL
ncbi:MAG: flagellar basal-body rod protein FlgG [endosymbiont of Galathealinum brachiosum]|uniref:Flagellar basal-body rod protein FlgG n=1 Tax=endosymbiont of Galathealinum brachiosum TaxID=2200906 RepID=A0A370DJF5_9GAMM|nr:MAG: flagellar basal-body rod protein FlgG [endosymbiont of Galathealinum brachiosum]